MSQIDIFETMLAKGQDSGMLRNSLGNAYFNEQKNAQAIEHLEKAVELKPDYSAAWKTLGRALAADGQLGKAKDAFDQGETVALANGDKQAAKEIVVFRKRVIKALGEWVEKSNNN